MYVHVNSFSCTVTIRTDKVDVLQVASPPDNWTLISSNPSVNTTSYTYVSNFATIDNPSPLPFNFTVQEKVGVTDAYQTPQLLTMDCQYQTSQNMTLPSTLVPNNTNVNEIATLTTNSTSDSLPPLQQCPTVAPTSQPSKVPTKLPSAEPTSQPSRNPTHVPSKLPSNVPSERPTGQPTTWPTIAPSNQPSNVPTMLPTVIPSERPSQQPTLLPSKVPTRLPSILPSQVPTGSPSLRPSRNPTSKPTLRPSKEPSQRPTKSPTSIPSKVSKVQRDTSFSFMSSYEQHLMYGDIYFCACTVQMCHDTAAKQRTYL
jgi:hypothetical protein